MWVSCAELRRLLEQVKAAEARALAAESALAVERRERMADVRHVVSQFLRREKTFPLPPTAEEKAEAKVEAEEIKSQPVPLTEVQLAMREANRKDAAARGISQEDADRDFEKYMLDLMDE
jgi:hypothetical protein